MQTLNDKTLSTKTIAIIMLIVIATMLVVSICMMSQVVLADEVSDIGTEVSDGITSITNTIKKIVNPIATVAGVCCGIFLVVGSDPASLKKVKTWLISIVAGLLLVNLADNLIEWASNIAK